MLSLSQDSFGLLEIDPIIPRMFIHLSYTYDIEDSTYSKDAMDYVKEMKCQSRTSLDRQLPELVLCH